MFHYRIGTWFSSNADGITQAHWIFKKYIFFIFPWNVNLIFQFIFVENLGLMWIVFSCLKSTRLILWLRNADHLSHKLTFISIIHCLKSLGFIILKKRLSFLFYYHQLDVTKILFVKVSFKNDFTCDSKFHSLSHL